MSSQATEKAFIPCLHCGKPIRFELAKGAYVHEETGLAYCYYRNTTDRATKGAIVTTAVERQQAKERRAIVVKMRDSLNMTFPEIGRAFGCSRQRAEQMYRYRQYRARALLWAAVKKGRIVPPTHCQECHLNGRILHGHHDDYRDWRTVIWVCSGCHSRIHPHPGYGHPRKKVA